MANEVGKAVSTISLIGSALDLFKSLAIVFTMTMLEFARKKQAKAEFERDKAENDLEIERDANEIENKAESMDSAGIIDNFLDERDSADGEG